MKLLITTAFMLTISILSFNTNALEVGDEAPCVVLKQMSSSGEEFEDCIREPNVEGQLKVLEFFSATCSACVKNLPKVSALADEFGDTVTFRLVGIDRNEQLLKDFITNYRSLISFDVAFDTSRDAKRAFDVFATPTMFILDENNVVIYKHIGVLRDIDIKNLKELFSTN